jgi:hypothetical protein
MARFFALPETSKMQIASYSLIYDQSGFSTRRRLAR